MANDDSDEEMPSVAEAQNNFQKTKNECTIFFKKNVLGKNLYKAEDTLSIWPLSHDIKLDTSSI